MKVVVREATESDSEAVLEWRNDVISVSNSFSNIPVPAKEHKKWFHAALENADVKLFIGLAGNDRIEFGVVRLALCDANICEVSINLAPKWRGKGLGSQLLKICIDNFNASHDTIYVAQIKRSNLSSQKCFENAVFALYQDLGDKLVYINKQNLIDKVENVRSRNNVNWMNLMRLAFTVAPMQAEEIFREINKDDAKISGLLEKLTQKVEI